MLHMGPLEEGCRHLQVLVARRDCQLVAVGSRSQDGSVQQADLAEQFGFGIRRDCMLAQEDIRRLAVEGTSL